MTVLRPTTLACIAVLSLAAGVGCGSSKSSDSPSGAGTSKQDSAAKASAIQLQAELEACFVDQQTYAACKKPPGTQQTLGSSAGQVEVSAASDAGYTIVAHSQSGADFTLVKDATGTLTRTCDKSKKGGCNADGTW